MVALATVLMADTLSVQCICQQVASGRSGTDQASHRRLHQVSLLFNYMQCQSHADTSFIYAQLHRLQLAMTRGSNHASGSICGTKR